MPLDRFMLLLAAMDVLLDPPHFGSGNTLYEAMACGVPIVTWPGPFMRGRVVSGAYHQMGIPDAPIVLDLADYARVAVALAQDAGRRQALRDQLRRAARNGLYSDFQAIREFEAFLKAAVIAAGQGVKLPAGWQPDAVPAGQSEP